MRQCIDRLAKIEQEMARLSQSSRQAVPVCGAYLALHRRRETGYTHLRWREAGGAKRHLLADEVAQRLAGQSQAVRQWFGQAAELAEAFNAAHYQARSALRIIRRQQADRPAALWPRAIG
jgi:hypothetical protein